VLAEYFYAWIGLRLARGTAGIPDLQHHLAALAGNLQQRINQATHRNYSGLSFSVSRSGIMKMGGHPNIAAATRHHARDATRTLATLGLSPA
jgi:hypothetical protein